MTEATLKQSLVACLKNRLPGAVVFRHEDRFRAGIPDISVTWGHHTSWLEVKYAAPRIRAREFQDVTLRDLARHGWGSFMVVYFNHAGVVETRVIDPLNNSILRTPGLNHNFVVEIIRDNHQS